MLETTAAKMERDETALAVIVAERDSLRQQLEQANASAAAAAASAAAVQRNTVVSLAQSSSSSSSADWRRLTRRVAQLAQRTSELRLSRLVTNAKLSSKQKESFFFVRFINI